MSGYLRIIPMLACMGMIFFLSHLPGGVDMVLFFPGADKLAHVAVYAVLSGTVVFAFSPRARSERRGFVLAATILIPVLFGISDEYHQSFVAGRSSDLFDVMADLAGALLMGVLWYRKMLPKYALKLDI